MVSGQDDRSGGQAAGFLAVQEPAVPWSVFKGLADLTELLARNHAEAMAKVAELEVLRDRNAELEARIAEMERIHGPCPS